MAPESTTPCPSHPPCPQPVSRRPPSGMTVRTKQEQGNRAFRPDAIDSTPTTRPTITADQRENSRQINAWCALRFVASSHNAKYTLRRSDDRTAPRETG